MKVKNLVSWAGASFSYAPGAIIDLPDEVATARIAAGLVEAIPEDGPTPAPTKTAATSRKG